MTELLSTPANDFTPSDTKHKEVVHFLRVIVICSEAFSFWSPSQHLSLYSSSFLNPYTVVQVFSYLSDGPRWWLPFILKKKEKLVSERPFSYLSDSWFPPQRPPQSYVRLQRVFGKLEMVNLFWCSHVGKPDIWAPFQHLPGSFESELSFLCRLCGVTVLCVCQYCWHDWHAVACWQLALWSLAFPPSAVLLLRNCRRPSPPDSVVCLAPGLRATVSGTF